MVHKTNELPSNLKSSHNECNDLSHGANFEIVNIGMSENTIKEVTMGVDND
jgi:hypothetical protein